VVNFTRLMPRGNFYLHPIAARNGLDAQDENKPVPAKSFSGALLFRKFARWEFALVIESGLDET
jgi:hypothetical protein